ncbi:14012_t:CDS:2 [Racocetra persica]|uniref:14012_t:CDS:1 n=1 Tax=Racocetra persica TaxID=160502 RepID=A0ACA9PY36_9GLOM|nr:14012_t:CDS:2 [Racocetra persica]
MSSELELLRRVAKLEAENTKLKQIIEEIANLRIENTKLKPIIKQNRTTNDASQTPIPPSINSHSENDSTDSLNLVQTQTMKTRQKENLCWYCYTKAYENRVMDIKSTNNIDDQLARTLVYNEIRM